MNLIELEAKIKETINNLENELEYISKFHYSDYHCHVIRKKLSALYDFLKQVKE